MRERGILFSSSMVRALLAGTKTQTRRTVAMPRTRDSFVLEDHGSGWWPYQSDDGESALCNDGNEHPYRCPFGVPGDRLWVREAWLPDPPIDDTWASTEWSGCGRHINEVPERFRHPRFCCYRANWLHGEIVWRPSIHMPRWASRITLEVTEVRVERLNSITEADCVAEGAPGGHGAILGYAYAATPHEHYRHVWESINGAGSWERNDWVWAVSFQTVLA